MERTFNIGLIKVPGYQRRQRLEITVELRDTERGSALSITGNIGKSTFGQINNITTKEIQSIEYAKGWNEDRLLELLNVWEDWHLNDMNSGTPGQMEIIRPWLKTVSYPNNDYTAQCAELGRHGMLVDNGYKYGTAWLFQPLPVGIDAEIRALIGQQ